MFPERKGYLSLILHAHLPYVRHPEHEEFLEEDWFYEAVLETYLPLLSVFDGLVADGVDFRVTISLSPTLVSMMRDPLLQNRCLKHIERLIELSEKEIERTRDDPRFNRLARMYRERFLEARFLCAERCRMDIPKALGELQETGKLEIITCAATHGFLPVLRLNENAVRAQIGIGVAHYEETFGRRPRGIWLPECGYYAGLDKILRDEGIRYFFLDTHGILRASSRPRYSVFAPIYMPSGVAAFGRDPESSKQVWSSKEGYPGHCDYREFYRDIGYDLDYEYIKPYILPDGKRINTGIKYYRITGEADEKEPYDRERALERAAADADHFVLERKKQVEALSLQMDRSPIVVAPYDAELFGHWWFEGPEWLDFVIRKIANEHESLRLITPAEYLDEYPVNQVAQASTSSWGNRGYAEVWVSGWNDWIYPHLHEAAERMGRLARENADAKGVLMRALNQAARELLLAQASDWAFIMKTRTNVDYAINRIKGHLRNFLALEKQIREGRIYVDWLSKLEGENNLFPEARSGKRLSNLAKFFA